MQYGICERATEENVGVPMLRMNNLQADGWDLTDLKYIQLGEEDLERYQLQPGDLLFNRTNSKELVGKCEVFHEPWGLGLCLLPDSGSLERGSPPRVCFNLPQCARWPGAN